MKKVKILLLLFFVFCWSYRLYKINGLIVHSVLSDFKVYYDAARTVVVGHPDTKLIVHSTYGPPIVLLGFLPFALIPFTLSEYLITYISLIGFGVTFYLFWQNYPTVRNNRFLILIGLMAFSFPLIFSLGMGNPLGIVTVGIYSVFLVKSRLWQWFLFVYSGVLKLFPFVLATFLLLQNGRLEKKSVIYGLSMVIILVLLSTLLLPRSIWSAYSQFSRSMFVTLSQEISTNKYNQGFSSTMARTGSRISSFSGGYYLFVSILILEIGWVIYHKIKKIAYPDDLDLGVLLICFVLLVHPFPWQHYYAVLLPFLVYKVAVGKLLYVFPLILISMDHGLLNSSQFVGTLVLFILLFIHSLRKSFNMTLS